MNPKRMLFALSALLALMTAAGAVLSEPAPAAQASAEQYAPVHVLYLPVVNRSPSLLYGRVTDGGNSASGVPVSLRFYNGAAWSTQATVSTGSTGRYEFVNQPGLGAGQSYQVVFENTAGSDSRLAWWGTRHLTSFAAGSSVHLGDFDLAAVNLSEPAHPATVGLPATFRWTRRPASGTDSYALRIYDPSDLNPLYVAPYVGYGESFTINSLPSGFLYGADYTWDVILLAPDGATGVSRQARSVRFHQGINGRVTQNGAAAGGVPLQLRFFNGAVWSTLATTTTASDGRYAFTSVPTLGAGQRYYVRYQNVTQTAGRLFLWSTRSLTAYAAGTAVDLGSFDIADVALVGPPGGASITLPYAFQWTRRAATPSDGYILEVYDPADYQPRWLSPLLGYAESYVFSSLSVALNTGTPYAWDLIISSPDGGSGVSRMARLVQFANRGSQLIAETPADWPFDEELPARPPEDFEDEGLITGEADSAEADDGEPGKPGEGEADGGETEDDGEDGGAEGDDGSGGG